MRVENPWEPETRGVETHSNSFPQASIRGLQKGWGRAGDPRALPSVTHRHGILPSCLSLLSCPRDPGKDPGLLGKELQQELCDAKGGVENS